jgi:hypothetical protein
MWEEKDNTLYKKFTFQNFSEAFVFMTRVAIEAEKWTIIQNGLIPITSLKSGYPLMMQEIL